MKAFIGLLIWFVTFLQFVASVYGVLEDGSTCWEPKSLQDSGEEGERLLLLNMVFCGTILACVCKPLSLETVHRSRRTQLLKVQLVVLIKKRYDFGCSSFNGRDLGTDSCF